MEYEMYMYQMYVFFSSNSKTRLSTATRFNMLGGWGGGMALYTERGGQCPVGREWS